MSPPPRLPSTGICRGCGRVRFIYYRPREWCIGCTHRWWRVAARFRESQTTPRRPEEAT